MPVTLAQRGSEENVVPALLRGDTPLSILFLLFAIPIVLALGTLLYAVALRLAAKVMGFGEPDFKTASICAIVTYASNFGLGFSLSATTVLLSSVMAPENSYRRDMGFAMSTSPLVVITLVIGTFLVAGLVASRTLRVDGGASRLMFWDSLILVLFANAMITAFAWVMSMVIRFLFALS